MPLRLISAPEQEPVSLAEAKAHLRVDFDDDDDLITLLIRAARTHIDGKDGWLGRALVRQTWELVVDTFPCDDGEIKIPLPPLQSIESIKYDDADGVEQTLASDQYDVDNVSEPGWVVPTEDGDGWPDTLDAVNAVRIRFVAGYPESEVDGSPEDLAGNVPAAIKQALLMYIATLYEHRENTVIGQAPAALPWAAEHLLFPYRIF
jgi:uncharacterized phiE125 gp8 family phage protein